MTQSRRSANASKLTNLGVVLKDERLSYGLSQASAAAQFKISLKSLRSLEQGHGGVPISTATRILSFFGKELRVGDIVSSPKKQFNARPRKSEVLETLSLIHPILTKKFGIRKIALFGSVARDQATSKSDVDLAVTFTDPEKADFEVIGKLVAFLETMLDGNSVDLVDESKMLPAVKKNAKADFIYVG